jgi:TetR/AcrR family transcriptional regulator, mexJK operon transcriptional repressor
MPRPKSSGLPKAEEEQLRLTNLLDAATEVFFEMGYEGASTAEIASRAHSSKRELYARFASKEDLFLAVIDYRTAKVADRITVLFQQQQPIRELLLEIARELLRSLLSEEHVALMRLVYTQARQFPKAAQFMTERGPDRGIANLAAHLKKQAQQGTLAIPDPQLAAQHFAGLLIGDLVHRAMLGQEVPTSRKQIEARSEGTVAAFLKLYGRP